MTLLAFLTDDEQKEFNYPPLLSAETRALGFSLTEDGRLLMARLAARWKVYCLPRQPIRKRHDSNG